MKMCDDEDGRKAAKRRSRSPRVKAVPRDPRHDPEAALAKIRHVLGESGTSLTENEARAWLGRIDVGTLQSETVEKAELDKEGRLRFREPNEKHGPGRLKMRSEQAIEQAEADFARALNADFKVGNLLRRQKAAIQRAGDLRSLKGLEVAEKVCALYDVSLLPIRNRASAIASNMTKAGKPISSRHVRSILRTFRPIQPD